MRNNFFFLLLSLDSKRKQAPHGPGEVQPVYFQANSASVHPSCACLLGT